MIRKLVNNPAVRQFVSYVFVGGIAAIVEWVFFWLFSNVLNLNYILSTALAFVFSTAANLILGRVWTFRDNNSYKNKRFKETVLIYVVSAIGLLFNMLLMYLFVTVLKLDTPFLKVASKVAATGIVFFWNFFIRKLVIYRKKEPAGEAPLKEDEDDA